VLEVKGAQIAKVFTGIALEAGSDRFGEAMNCPNCVPALAVHKDYTSLRPLIVGYSIATDHKETRFLLKGANIHVERPHCQVCSGSLVRTAGLGMLPSYIKHERLGYHGERQPTHNETQRTQDRAVSTPILLV
jgi:hypothetical protein